MASNSSTKASKPRSSDQIIKPKQNVALQGAAMAFGRPPIKPKPTLKPFSQNPALVAASKADRDSTSVSVGNSAQSTEDTLAPSHIGRDSFKTGWNDGVVRSMLHDLPRDKDRPTQRPMKGPTKGPTKGSSESHIAASLAASRSISTSPNRKSNTGQQGTFYNRETRRSPRSHRSTENINSHATVILGKSLGNASMSSISSSINASEQLTSGPIRTPDYLQTDGHATTQAYRPSLDPMKSTLNPLTPQFQRPLSNSGRDLLTPGPDPMPANTLFNTPDFEHTAVLPNTIESRPTLPRKLARANTQASLPSFDTVSKAPDEAIDQPALKSKTLQTSTNFNNSKSMQKHVPDDIISNPLMPESGLEADRLESPTSPRGLMGIYTVSHMKKGHGTLGRNAEDEDSFSDNSFVSVSDGLSSDLPQESTYVDPNHISPRQQPKRPRMTRPKSETTAKSSMSVNSLADAMVASALASSRSQSPSIPNKKTAPAPPTSRHSTASLFTHTHTHNSQSSRTPSPTKSGLYKHHTGGKSALRTTMRTTARSSEDEDVAIVKHGRRNPIKKHPNKHREGDRKRWRDAVSDRERKRYEGLWASNKGLFAGITPTMPKNNQDILPMSSQSSLSTVSLNGRTLVYFRSPPGDCVSSLTVRDIWSRSRLPADILSDIWELVDHSGTGMLSRDEFVVGVWLIDQRLKGRKLPQRVSESVWDSVGTLGGIKVKDKHA